MIKKLLLFSLFLYSCSTTSQYVQLEGPEAKALLRSLSKARARVRSIHIRARAEYYGKGKARKGYLEVFAKDKQLRVEVWGPTDVLLEYLVVCGDSVVDVDPPHRRCVVGHLEEGFLTGFNGMGGYPPLFAGLGPHLKKIKVFENKEGLRIEGQAGTLECTEDLSRNGLLIRFVCKDTRRVISVEQSRFFEKQGLEIPGLIRIKGKNTETIMKYRQIEINPSIEEGAFDCSCPEGFEIRTAK